MHHRHVLGSRAGVWGDVCGPGRSAGVQAGQGWHKATSSHITCISVKPGWSFPSIVKYCQVLSSIVKYCQVTTHACLSNLADLFQVLSFVYWVYSVLASLSPILRIVAFHNFHDYDDAWWTSTLLILTKRGYHWRRSSGTWIKPLHLIDNFIVIFQATFIGIVLSQFKFKAD